MLGLKKQQWGKNYFCGFLKLLIQLISYMQKSMLASTTIWSCFMSQLSVLVWCLIHGMKYILCIFRNSFILSRQMVLVAHYCHDRLEVIVLHWGLSQSCFIIPHENARDWTFHMKSMFSTTELLLSFAFKWCVITSAKGLSCFKLAFLKIA